MAWDFETDPEFQEKLDWADAFVREEVEPLDHGLGRARLHAAGRQPAPGRRPAQAGRSGDQGLWATHLGPDLGGEGYGQVKLSLLNEILGRSSWAPIVFGCQAPGHGQRRDHRPLRHRPAEGALPRTRCSTGEVFSCYSMTEPHAGADPTMFTTRAEKDGDEWVINGWKFFSSNANTASFLIVMVVTNPDVSAYKGMSMFLVPTDTPGVNIVRNVGLGGEPVGHGSHALIHYEDVRVPEDALLGGEGQAFAIAQTRLGGGRIHHAMRTIGMSQKALDMMCERALSRETQGCLLADKQFVQGYIADSYAQLLQFRLLTLLHGVGDRQVQRLPQGPQGHRHGQGRDAHGPARHRLAGHAGPRRPRASATRCPSPGCMLAANVMGLADGPTEVHKVTVARQVLRDHRPSDDLWPTEHMPKKVAAAREKLAEFLEHEVGNL